VIVLRARVFPVMQFRVGVQGWSGLAAAALACGQDFGRES
jgi:hypothetical protein